MENLAKEFYTQGYSCSEAVIKAAVLKGLVKDDLMKVATAFSGGMSSGCLCGAVAASQMVLGAMYGRDDLNQTSSECRDMAKKFVDEFKAKNQLTCCRALSGKYAFASPERKANCTRIIGDAVGILEELILKEVKS